eukprot:TRINITY_DN80859_c0_g1_i1.p2 TRINITY_DN80859_c0_g1~~TRINITY_DN80859_c0_g1_i1.p2  ORF type:complete len:121 (+),score=10.90 TRINITY_DN80859_c0_g1_i1:169-531(+)
MTFESVVVLRLLARTSDADGRSLWVPAKEGEESAALRLVEEEIVRYMEGRVNCDHDGSNNDPGHENRSNAGQPENNDNGDKEHAKELFTLVQQPASEHQWFRANHEEVNPGAPQDGNPEY